MHADEHRRALGFLTVAETDEYAEVGVRILDPAATFISRRVALGAGTVVYPTAIINAEGLSTIEFTGGGVLYPGCVVEACGGGHIRVGAGCELGPGGVHLRADGPAASIVLEAEVRLTGGCELGGACELGRGAQILGAISARSVRLGGGRGGHRWPVADERGAVLKGTGIADGVVLGQGEVKSCRSSFDDSLVERQSAYHPPPES